MRHRPIWRGRALVRVGTLLIGAATLALARAADAPQPPRHVPTFTDYPAPAVSATVSAIPSAAPAAPRLQFTSAQGRRYRTVIRDAAAQGPNFAGHYRLATWGCGTDCRGFAIVNLRTGRVYTPPRIPLVAGVMGNDDERLAYRPGSRLLIISGALDDDPARAGQFHYLWTGQELRLLSRQALRVEQALTD